MIKLENVTKKYGEKIALDNVTLEIPEVGLVVIKGKNGSGKSTLVNIISGMSKATSGSVTVLGKDLSKLSEKELALYREKYVSMIFQDDNLFMNMRVCENLKIVGGKLNEDVIDKLKLQNLLEKRAKELSGGERERVSIARAFFKNTRFLFADEPTSAIDSKTKDDIFKMLKEYSKTRLVILITHEMNKIEEYADVVIELENGKVKTYETINKVRALNQINPYKIAFDVRKYAKSNLFVNKKRVVRSCLLLIFSFLFILLSVSLSQLNYNSMHIDTMLLEKEDIVVLNKNEYSEESDYYSLNEKGFKEEDLKILEQDLGESLETLYTLDLNGKWLGFDFGRKDYGKSYYNVKLRNYYLKSKNDLNRVEYGHMPSGENEVVISSYVADLMMEFGVKDSKGEYYKPKSYDELISNKREIEFGDKFVTLSGVYRLNLKRYESLKEKDNLQLFKSLDAYINFVGGFVYVDDAFYKVYKEDMTNLSKDYSFTLKDKTEGGIPIMHLEVFDVPVDVTGLETIETLNDDEIIISIGDLQKYNDLYGTNLTRDNSIGEKIEIYATKWKAIESIGVFTIKGISLDNISYLSSESLSKYFESRIFLSKVIVRANSKESLTRIFDKYPYRNSNYTMETLFSERYEKLSEGIHVATIIFKILSIVFAVLSISYLLNYILNSVEIHKKDIAILKALGVEDKTILSTNLYELINITLMSYLYSLVLFIMLKFIANYVISHIFEFKVNILPIDLFAIIEIILVTLVIDWILSRLSLKIIKKTSPEDIFKKSTI